MRIGGATDRKIARSQDAWQGLGVNLANRDPEGRRTARSQDRKMPGKVLGAILRTRAVLRSVALAFRFARLPPRPSQAYCDLAILRSAAPPIRKIAPKTFPGILRSCDLAVHRPWTCQRWVRKIDPRTSPGIMRSCDLAVRRPSGECFFDWTTICSVPGFATRATSAGLPVTAIRSMSDVTTQGAASFFCRGARHCGNSQRQSIELSKQWMLPRTSMFHTATSGNERRSTGRLRHRYTHAMRTNRQEHNTRARAASAT